MKFVCLSSVSADKPPTSVKERTILANLGLGDAIVTFNLDCDSLHFHDKKLEAFPKLNSTEYELFLYDRSGKNPSFCHLKHPYIPKKLKVVAEQCKIYIKPIQKDLVDKFENEDDEIQVKSKEQYNTGCSKSLQIQFYNCSFEGKLAKRRT